MKQSILLIEDEAAIAKPLIKLMKMKEYQVNWVASGSEGLQLLQSGKTYDCLLIVVMMPEMSGWEFRDQEQRLPNPHPAIFFSADRSAMKEAEKRGECFIEKPIDLPELFMKLENITKELTNDSQTN